MELEVEAWMAQRVNFSLKMAAMGSQVKQEVQALINSAANADEKGDYFVRTHPLLDDPRSASPRAAHDHLVSSRIMGHCAPPPPL